MPDIRDYRRRGGSWFAALGIGTTATAAAIITQILTGSKTHDWASIADAARATTTVTVTGAALGDIVVTPSMSVDTLGVMLDGYVSAANTVTVMAHNESGAPADIASGTLKVVVLKVELSA